MRGVFFVSVALKDAWCELGNMLKPIDLIFFLWCKWLVGTWLVASAWTQIKGVVSWVLLALLAPPKLFKPSTLSHFIWLLFHDSSCESFWVGESYLPGASDPRFRALQGRPGGDHFDNLRHQLNLRSNSNWICGDAYRATCLRLP